MSKKNSTAETRHLYQEGRTEKVSRGNWGLTKLHVASRNECQMSYKSELGKALPVDVQHSVEI